MAVQASRLIAGLAATGLAVAAGFAFYWFSLEERPLSVAGRVQASGDSSTRLSVPSWDSQRPSGLEGEAEQFFVNGMEAYNRKDYSMASTLLYKAATLAPASPDVHFYLGISYLQTRDSVAGSRELKTVAALASSPFVHDARLHLADALIKRGDGAGAREYLAPVVAAGGPQGAQARALVQASYPGVGGN